MAMVDTMSVQQDIKAERARYSTSPTTDYVIRIGADINLRLSREEAVSLATDLLGLADAPSAADSIAGGHAGYLVDGKDFYYPDFPRSEWPKHKSVVPLYLRAQQAKVPAEWEELADDDAGRKAFGLGWNACRKEMLSSTPVAWITDAPLVCGEKVTKQKNIADAWLARGWNVSPLVIAAPEHATESGA